MSNSNAFDHLRDVKKGRTDWRIKCRVIRQWRGMTQNGELFKNFNVLLLDSKDCMIHAFAPTNVADRLGKTIQVGKICLIKNFQVKDYTEKDVFRPIQMDRQIIFTLDTKALQIEETDIFIPNNMFDFFQFEDLKEMSLQQMNLIDVIGVMETKDTALGMTTKNGKNHVNIKFKLSDGKKTINVTFWGPFAEDFKKLIENEMEEPIIVIVASAKVSSWKDQIDICNNSPTKVYLNYDHHSVVELRKLWKDPAYSQNLTGNQKKTFKLCTIDQINNLPKDYAEEEVICKATIEAVEQVASWNFAVCTSCYTPTKTEQQDSICTHCKRIVLNPIRRFSVGTLISDNTGKIKVILNDREMRSLLGKFVEEVENEDKSFPKVINNIQGKQYTFKLLITEANLNKKDIAYVATNILQGFELNEDIISKHSNEAQTQSVTTEPSASSYHLDTISQVH